MSLMPQPLFSLPFLPLPLLLLLLSFSRKNFPGVLFNHLAATPLSSLPDPARLLDTSASRSFLSYVRIIEPPILSLTQIQGAAAAIVSPSPQAASLISPAPPG